MNIISNFFGRRRSAHNAEIASAPAPPVVATLSRPSASAGYLRDTRSAVISTRHAPLSDSRDEIRRSWRRVAGLAQDMVRNSGRLSGAINQIVADTIGTELQLVPVPDPAVLQKLGYSDKEISDLVGLIKKEWKYWSWNARECHLHGKFTIQQQFEIGLRDQLIFGEAVGIIGWFDAAARQRYKLNTGSKPSILSPTRLVQDTAEEQRLFQGVLHDENLRIVGYRFRSEDSLTGTQDWPAFDAIGNAKAFHVFEPTGARDVRGISPMAAAIRKNIQHEMLEDATLQMALLQTAIGISLTSEAPSQDAFEALAALKESGSGDVADQLADTFIGMYASQITKARESKLHFGSDPNINHLAPGEKLEVAGAVTPGPEYDPFSMSLSRDMARAIGVTYESFTLDNRNATYASSRVSISSIWPIVLRRRERVVAPIGDAVYGGWLDEQIATGKIPFKGGYRAFRANRDRLTWTQWRGPAKPSADDSKSAEASGKRLENYNTTVEIEAAELGHDADELRLQQEKEHKWYTSRGMRSPYDHTNPSAASSEKRGVR
ncbi:phage portal protein [Neorhizobium galegae]|uniref:Phage portal protein, lambda family n=1 Tax=Neorhizobium galegae bv. officinalis TaxID=323656 RepID=A0A0T7H0R5_NEOGA|nr:phage portal protein [Neorhizobium galegae]CDZ53068.1 Phage portal protein, lambda family [Neorhizobium galegae bv. officinalis]